MEVKLGEKTGLFSDKASRSSVWSASGLGNGEVSDVSTES